MAKVEDYQKQYKALLSNKDNLVGKKHESGVNQYAYQINQLKKRMKDEGLKFGDLSKMVKKQEREGTFDRGAEGKAKNKLRKKMAAEPKTQLTKGVHAGSRADKILSKGTNDSREPRTSEENVDLSKALSGETAAEREKRKNKMTTAKIGKSR
tara:strand:+ start:772 stop:1230 length:459 start_codon:yes stop_codon:yes gene_type:complete